MASYQALQQAIAKRTLRTGATRPTPSALRVEKLEDRSVPSTSIPLSGVQWTPIGPAPIEARVAGDLTTAPGNLPTGGSVVQVSAHPTLANTFYAAAAGGGVHVTTDGGTTWTPLTDHLPDAVVGNDVLNRSLNMGAIAVSPHNPNLILAGQGDATFGQYSYAGRGLLRSADGGTTWTLIKGPINGTVPAFDRGRIPKIVYHPTDPNIVFVVANGGGKDGTAKQSGLYRSSDAGLTWTEVTVNLPNAASVSGVPLNRNNFFSDFSLNTANPEIGYLAVGEPNSYVLNGVYRVGGIGSTGISTGAPGGMVWVSTLGGTSLTLPGTTNPIGAIKVTPGVRDAGGANLSSTVYALLTAPGTQGGGGLRALFRSQDSGINWTQLTTVTGGFNPSVYAYDLLVDPRNSNRVYMSGQNGVIRIDVTDGPTGTLPTVVTTVLTLDATNQGPNVAVHDLEFDANFRVLAATDGGVFRLNSESPIDWVAVNGTAGNNKGLAVTRTLATSIHPVTDDTMVASTYLNGTINFTDPGGPVVPNDPLYAWAARDQTPLTSGNLINDAAITVPGTAPTPNTILRSVQSSAVSVRQSFDNGQSWQTVNTGIVNPTQFFNDPAAPLENDPSVSGRYFYGTDVLNRTTNNAALNPATWAQFGPNLPFVTGVNANHVISAIGVGRQDGNLHYAAVTNRRLNGVDFGPALYMYDPRVNPQQWFDVSPGRVNGGGAIGATPDANSLIGRIVDIAIDPTDSDTLYVVVDAAGTGPTGTNRIYKTTVGGFGLNAWTDITGNLPADGTSNSLHPYSITIDPNTFAGLGSPDDDVLYIGTTMGVWSLTSPRNSTVWTQLNTLPGGTQTLPDAVVRDVKVNTTLGVLSAATLGRGVWEYQIRPYISGFVFEDLNGNGLREAGEGPLQNIRVVARDTATNAQFADIVTRADGFYVFRSLPNGNYSIELGDTTNFQLTTPDRNYTVTQTSTQTGADLGVFFRTSIGGVKFNDLDGDGTRDTGEPGLANWQIELRRADTNALVTGVGANPLVTGLDGSYTFGGLGVIQDRSVPFSPLTGYPVINYRVREINQPTWIQTSTNPADIAITSQTPVTTANFGNFKEFTVSGIKFEDVNGDGLQQLPVENGLGGWVITLTNLTTSAVATATTGTDGSYSFANLGPGIYQVRETAQAGWGQVTADPANILGTSGTDVTGVNFGNFSEATISGTVYEDTNGNGFRDPGENTFVAGATVSLIDASTGLAVAAQTTSFGAGTYSFTNLLPIQKPGNTIPYLIRVTAPSVFAQTMPDRQVLLQSGAVAAGQDMLVFRRTSLSGQAFEDQNGDGVRNGADTILPFFSVALLDGNTNATVATATTDVNGNFTFLDLPPTGGAGVPPYKVAITVPGWLQTAGSGSVSLVSGIPTTGLFVGAFKQAAFTGVKYNDLNGNGVRDAGEPGLAGWTVNLINAATAATVGTAVTDAAGAYTLLAGPGVYTVREVNQAGWQQTSAFPPTVMTLSQQVFANQNFGNFQLVTITATTFNDSNGNGIRDGSEGVVSGHQVRLLDAAGTVLRTGTSNSAGQVVFGGVGPGTYQLLEVPPAGSTVSSANPVFVTTRSGTGAAVSFGNYLVSTITGTVFEDLDGSGVQDNGETGAAGFTVQLRNAGGTVVATAVTDANGTYSFGNVGGGSYTVRLVPLAGWAQLTANPGAVAPTSGQTLPGGNFGVVKLGTLSGTVFLDRNRNFRKDSAEAGAVGAEIGLYDAAGSLVATAPIGADGSYSFINLQPGAYAVRLTNTPGNLVGYSPTSADYVRDVALGSTNPSNSFTGLDFPLSPRNRYALAADGGGGPRVQVYDSVSGQQISDSFVYEESFTGGVRAVMADVNADGIPDLITVAGPGGGPRVRVLSGKDGSELYNFFVYEETFRDGMFVAAGDVDGDGYADIVTGTAPGGGPRVAVFSGRTGVRLADFFAYDENFRGGVRVGAADTIGDGTAEVVTGAGPGGGPNIRVWNALPLQLLSSFFAFDSSFTGGVYVAGSLARPDIGGRSTILVGSGMGYPNPRVREFDSTGRMYTDIDAFSPLSAPYKSEVRVASVDRNGDQYPDIAIAAGPGSPPRLRFIDGRLKRQIGDEELVYENTFMGGIFIG